MKSTIDITAFDLASARILDEKRGNVSCLQPSDLNAQRLALNASEPQHSILDTSALSDLNAQRPTLNASEPNTQHPIPNTLPGRVSTFYTFYKGRKLGPYYVRRWKERGKSKKQYVKAKDLETIKEACARHRFKRNQTSALHDELNNIGKNIAFLLAMLRRSRKGDLRVLDYLHIDRIQEHGMSAPGCPPLRAKWVFMAPLFANFMKNSIYGFRPRAEPQKLAPNLWMQDGLPTKPLDATHLKLSSSGQLFGASC